MIDRSLSALCTEVILKLEKWHKFEYFFAAFTNPDGSLKSGINPYEAPDDFRRQFELQLESL
jgi:hypothetical protein